VIFGCDAILFDMDGTLIDSGVCVNRQWERWARKRQIDPAAVLAVSHGRRTVETMRILLPGDDVSADLEEFIEGEAADLQDVGCIPGAIDVAAQLPRERWAVVTSSARPVAVARLRHTGFPLPGALVTADDVEHGKPHPEPWLKAAADLGYAPGRCLVFEDANSGIQAACAAGMHVVGVRWSRERLECAYQIGSFADVRVEVRDELRVTIPDLPSVARQG
jgi:sugar-phosphatase